MDLEKLFSEKTVCKKDKEREILEMKLYWQNTTCWENAFFDIAFFNKSVKL